MLEFQGVTNWAAIDEPVDLLPVLLASDDWLLQKLEHWEEIE